MLDGVTDGYAEREEDDLCDGEESHTEKDVANRPSVIKSSDNKDELEDDVDDDSDERPQDIDDP